MQEAIKKIIINNQAEKLDRDSLEEIKRAYCKQYKFKYILNSDLLKAYRLLVLEGKIKRSDSWENLLRKRAVRTMSGIAPVAVLTKPYPCPGTCAYCPRQEDVPVSYLANEPAVMRAIRCDYDPYKQTVLRLAALENNGHEPTKIEIIVIGGTWSYLPIKYKYWYIASCFQAVNDYARLRKKIITTDYRNEDAEKNFFKTKLKSSYKTSDSLDNLKYALKKEQAKNETAWYRIIGLTLETRPDYLNEPEVLEMRELGCTRVEMGVQAIDDKILELNQRGHGIKEIADATNLLRKYGFKITYHLMPGLLGSSPARDLKMFKQLFSDKRFQPDQIKLYPTVVIEGSLLYSWYQQGKYRPYSDKVLQRLIIECKQIIPEYVRIIRLVRDIPGESIVAGNKITNLRQIIQNKGIFCRCIRCREVKSGKIGEFKINIRSYEAAGGREYFISADSKDNNILYGFCRLRLDQGSPIAPALIRELHVYGQLVSLGSQQKVQHSGLGRQLLAKAEELAKQGNLSKIAVISGVGVRGYYRRLGYRRQNTYLFKKI